MKYAFFPGCVSKGACPELYQSVMQVYPKLGIELEEMTTAACTGAGVLQEKDQRLGDALNARTFALAERKGLPIMTICSTCQGVMSQANHRLNNDPAYLAEINQILGEEGLQLSRHDQHPAFCLDSVRGCGRGRTQTPPQKATDRLCELPHFTAAICNDPPRH